MNGKRFLIFGFVFVLLISTSISTSAVDQSLIGVKNGEEYTFVLEKYYIYSEHPYYDTRIETVDYFYGDEGTIAIEDGDEFTYKITNSTAYDRNNLPVPEGNVQIRYIPPFAIKVQITGPNGTIVNDDLAVGFGTKLAETNWTGFKTILEDEKIDIANQQVDNPDINYIYEIIDTKSVFGFRFGSEFEGNESDPNTYSDINEIRYEKSTGMLSMISIEDFSTTFEGNESYDHEYIYKMKRKGYVPDEETALLPGFIVYVSITTLIIIIYSRKRYLSG